VFARQMRALRPGLVLLQNPYDLLFREPRSLPLSVLVKRRTLNPRGGKSLRQVRTNRNFSSHESPTPNADFQDSRARFSHWRIRS
jgi:hypothetical protein